MMSAHPLEIFESKEIYSERDLSRIDLKRVPRHIALMMDGNRRWARQKGLPVAVGYWEGAEILEGILKAASELGVKTLTVYTFSTENWSRPQEEIEDLMDLFEMYLDKKRDSMIRDGVKLDAIGNLEQLPPRVVRAFHRTKQATQFGEKINLVLALSYGSRDEIRRAVVKIVQAKIEPQEISEQLISRCLDTSSYGDPELLIRTSGEMRVSNFLLWQISYAEIIVKNVPWPDFSPQDLLSAIEEFQCRSRRLGS